MLLGPKGKAKSYHEIGRAIATLMSDEVCVPFMTSLVPCIYWIASRIDNSVP